MFRALLLAFCAIVGTAEATPRAGIGSSTTSANISAVTALGTLPNIFVPHASQVLDFSIGSTGTPNTSDGPVVNIGKVLNYLTTNCGSNNVEDNCGSALNVSEYGPSTNNQQVTGIAAYAQTLSANTAGDAFGITAHGFATGSSTHIGAGGYFLGRRDVSSARAEGMEVRATENSGNDCTTRYSGQSDCVGIWLTAQGQTAAVSQKLGPAVQLGNPYTTGQWTEGFTINNGAALNFGFNDQSSDVTVFNAIGTHTNGVHLNGGTFSGNAYDSPGYSVDGSGNVTPLKYVHGVTVLCQVSNAAATTHTGDTNETNLAACAVPAGAMGTQGMLRVSTLWLRTATTTNTVTYNARLSTSSGAITGVLFVNFTNAVSGNTTIQAGPQLLRNTSASAQQYTLATSIVPSAAANGAPSTAATNTAAATWVNFSCQDTTSSADTCGLYGYTVELITP